MCVCVRVRVYTRVYARVGVSIHVYMYTGVIQKVLSLSKLLYLSYNYHHSVGFSETEY